MNSPAKKRYESPRQKERQANILATTREMLAEIGYDKTTIRALAERADVAPGTLYNLYKSKDDLVLAAVSDLLATLGVEAQAQSEPGLARIMTSFCMSGEIVKANPEYAEAMTRALFGTQRGDRLRSILYYGFVDLCSTHIQIAIDQGLVEPSTDFSAVAKHLQAQSWGVVTAWVMGLIELNEVVPESARSIAMTLLSTTTPAGTKFVREFAKTYGVSI
jgi:AcrR family transcriptional regulator